jgi:hypothetical protein
MEMTYSLQNACLNSCAYLTFGIFAYVFFISCKGYKCISENIEICEGPIKNNFF